MPHIIVVRPTGIVYAITGGRDMSPDKLRALFNGDKVSFYPKATERILFDPAAAVGRSSILYQSVLTKWRGENQMSITSLVGKLKYLRDSTGMNVSMVPLKWLYGLAYLGYSDWSEPSDSLYDEVYKDLVIEVQDKSNFEFDYVHDVGKGTFNYSLHVPPSQVTLSYVMGIMQNDLKNTFGYDVSIEMREMPVWNLIAYPGAAAKLKTKGGEPYFSSQKELGVGAGFTAKNISVDKVLRLVMYYFANGQPPHFNETGIKHNIDIKMDVIMTDWNAVKAALNANGLALIKGTRLMKVLVIRDPPTDSMN
jgi:hypothetical protein